MGERNKKLIKLGVYILLLLWLGVFLAEKIDLTTADLGRHIENGKWVVENHFNLFEKNSPVHENFYSYTEPGFSAINHHWGSGVIFYEVYKIAGFTGLSLFYIVLSLAAFSVFFYIARKESNLTIASLLAVFLIPLIAERTEIRPEVFSYLLGAIFFLVLWLWEKNRISWRWLWLLPVLMIFWVNLHVYFFLGLFLIGAYLLWKIIRKEIVKACEAGTILFFTVLAALLNPFGIKGLLYPLQIFKNYGYTIVENKSVWFVENYGIMNSNFALIKAALALMIFSFVVLLIIDRRKFSVIYCCFAVFFGALGWLAIRNFSLLGYFALPVLAYNLENIFTPQNKKNSPAKESGLALVYIVVAVFAAYNSFQFLSAHQQKWGIGLMPGNIAAAEFLKRENIQGPYFNNYDIGGYLIFNLWPKQKVFVDNRPEAYPDSFFSDVYKPMQESPAVFKKIDEQYNFNAVVFSRNDITPWGMNFLQTIGESPDWAKAFEDNYAVIYLKRNEANKDLINRDKI